jgi:hypothetical protein
MKINKNVSVVTIFNAVEITVLPNGSFWDVDPMTGALHLRLKKETVKRIAAALSEKKKVNVPKKGAGRRLAAKLKELQQQPARFTKRGSN